MTNKFMKVRRAVIPLISLAILLSPGMKVAAVSTERVTYSGAQAQTYTATPSSDNTTLNGSPVTMQAYKINSNNYVKLRDFANMVNGTPLNFEVTWDGSLNAINMYTQKAYTPVGGEGAVIGTEEKQATDTTSAIYVNGQQVSLKGYNISNNNYFKLRDLGVALGIGIDWDSTTKTVIVDSTGSGETGTQSTGNTETGSTGETYELSPELEARLQEELDWIRGDGNDDFAKRVEAGWRTTIDPSDKRHPGWNKDDTFSVATLRPWQEPPKNALGYGMAYAGGKSSYDGITIN